jgi:hypothetical protein
MEDSGSHPDDIVNCVFCGSGKVEVRRKTVPQGHTGLPVIRVSCGECRPVDRRFYEIALDHARFVTGLERREPAWRRMSSGNPISPNPSRAHLLEYHTATNTVEIARRPVTQRRKSRRLPSKRS